MSTRDTPDVQPHPYRTAPAAPPARPRWWPPIRRAYDRAEPAVLAVGAICWTLNAVVAPSWWRALAALYLLARLAGRVAR